MSDYGWLITRDFYAQRTGDQSSVGTIGPSSISKDVEERLKKGEGVKFRLYDGDDELYAEGLQIEGNSGADGSFAPLDDYGMPNWGCTDMKQLQNGKWETL